MARDYYFVSDLHLGGDGDLQHCDFSREFIAFLKGLASGDDDTELVVGGDTFGFWELTSVEGLAKFDEIVRHHQAIFDALKQAGSHITITLMVGNHDCDLACDPQFAEKLAAYNLKLDTSISLQRRLLGKTIWIEHGQRVDPFNASPDYGNRYALPVGYFEGQGNETYLRRARQVFAENPDTAIYLFGHTHDAFLDRENGRAVINMGTWLKILDRVPVRLGYLPAVYHPSFRLGYFHIRAEQARIVIRHVEIPKEPARELGLLQRLVTFGRRPAQRRPIPAETVIEV